MTKKKFVLRVDEDTMSALERWAADDFRSTNGQLEWIITRALKEHGRLYKEQDSTPDDNKGETG